MFTGNRCNDLLVCKLVLVYGIPGQTLILLYNMYKVYRVFQLFLPQLLCKKTFKLVIYHISSKEEFIFYGRLVISLWTHRWTCGDLFTGLVQWTDFKVINRKEKVIIRFNIRLCTCRCGDWPLLTHTSRVHTRRPGCLMRFMTSVSDQAVVLYSDIWQKQLLIQRTMLSYCTYWDLPVNFYAYSRLFASY